MENAIKGRANPSFYYALSQSQNKQTLDKQTFIRPSSNCTFTIGVCLLFFLCPVAKITAWAYRYRALALSLSGNIRYLGAYTLSPL
jgi:hypothetical protein